MIVFVHDWGSYFVVSEFFGTIVSWHCLSSFPALFFAALLLLGDAKALVQPAVPWEGFSTSGDFSEGRLPSSAGVLSSGGFHPHVPSEHCGLEFTAASLNKIDQECKFFTSQDK